MIKMGKEINLSNLKKSRSWRNHIFFKNQLIKSDQAAQIDNSKQVALRE